MATNKRLYRIPKGKIVAGVCSGIGEYFNIDPVIVRLLWVLFACIGGSGLVAYLIAWIIVPECPADGNTGSRVNYEQ